MVIPGHSESITGEIKQRGEKEFRISLAPLNFPVASHRVHRGTPPCASKSKGTFVMPSGWLRNYQPFEGDSGCILSLLLHFWGVFVGVCTPVVPSGWLRNYQPFEGDRQNAGGPRVLLGGPRRDSLFPLLLLGICIFFSRSFFLDIF